MTTLPEKCPCHSNDAYLDCCGRYLVKDQTPVTAEQLMRSRYSAYALGKYQYIVDTYAKEKRDGIDADVIKQEQHDTQWQHLKVYPLISEDCVEFEAYYTYQKSWFMMHEKSTFNREGGKWVYLDGHICIDSGQFTPLRNDACPCASGKKFKKCCMP